MALIDNTDHLSLDASMGVPVGCLAVPKRHMGVVAPALANQGRMDGGKSWLRNHGIVNSDGDTFLLHLTIPGATALSSAAANVPEAVSSLLAKGDIEWRAGVRLRGTWRPPTAMDSELHRGARFKFVELFSGIGGFRLGLECLGGRCVLASEIDSSVAVVYRVNFPCSSHELVGDITEIEAAAAEVSADVNRIYVYPLYPLYWR